MIYCFFKIYYAYRRQLVRRIIPVVVKHLYYWIYIACVQMENHRKKKKGSYREIRPLFLFFPTPTIVLTIAPPSLSSPTYGPTETTKTAPPHPRPFLWHCRRVNTGAVALGSASRRYYYCHCRCRCHDDRIYLRYRWTRRWWSNWRRPPTWCGTARRRARRPARRTRSRAGKTTRRTAACRTWTPSRRSIPATPRTGNTSETVTWENERTTARWHGD